MLQLLKVSAALLPVRFCRRFISGIYLEQLPVTRGWICSLL